jgi:hypothetical protein
MKKKNQTPTAAQCHRVFSILNRDPAIQDFLCRDSVVGPGHCYHPLIRRVIKSLDAKGHDALRVADHLVFEAAIPLFLACLRPALGTQPRPPGASALPAHCSPATIRNNTLQKLALEPARASEHRTPTPTAAESPDQEMPQPRSAGRELPGQRRVVESLKDNPHQNAEFATSSANSTNSTGEHVLEQAVFPVNSLLDDYLAYARKQVESADSFLVGSFLPVGASCLARRVYFPWGQERIYANLFSMLAGKSGDRKSSAINLAEHFARRVLPPKQFLPHSCSAESLFNEFDQNCGGWPDKLLIAADANPILSTWTKSGYGERVGQAFLNLYDCKPLFEALEKHRTNNHQAGSRRLLEETSTSVVLGATFDICRLHGRGITSGLQRRHLFYAAAQHGRLISLAPNGDDAQFKRVANKLKKLVQLQGPCTFSADANALWDFYQRQNRRLLESETDEDKSARLNGAPRQVQKVAMIFLACRWANQSRQAWDGIINSSVLQLAISHVDHCLWTADWLDANTERTLTVNSADALLARIRRDFASSKFLGDRWTTLTKSQLTGKYASQPKRRNSWKPDDLYGELVPNLIKRGLAREEGKLGKKVSFGFLVEDAPELVPC